MKIIITENRLEKTIIGMIENYYDASDIVGVDSDGDRVDSWDNEDIIIYRNEKGEGDTVFYWYSQDYFEPQRFANSTINERFKKLTPLVTINESFFRDEMDEVFGDIWVPVFRKWFQDKFNVPVKTIG